MCLLLGTTKAVVANPYIGGARHFLVLTTLLTVIVVTMGCQWFAGLREGILCVWAILLDGHKVLIHVVLGTTEDYAVCLELSRDSDSARATNAAQRDSDGAPGLLRAIEEDFPQLLGSRRLLKQPRNRSLPGYDSPVTGAATSCCTGR